MTFEVQNDKVNDIIEKGKKMFFAKIVRRKCLYPCMIIYFVFDFTVLKLKTVNVNIVYIKRL